MTFRLSAAAEADLIDIFVSGAQAFGLEQAERYLDRIERAISLIGDNPRLARLRTEVTPPVRIHRVVSHLIVYVVADDGVPRVLRIRHHREDWIADPVQGKDRAQS